MTAYDPVRRFIGEPGRKTFGPYAECGACGFSKKDHGPQQECPEQLDIEPTIDRIVNDDRKRETE